MIFVQRIFVCSEYFSRNLMLIAQIFKDFSGLDFFARMGRRTKPKQAATQRRAGAGAACPMKKGVYFFLGLCYARARAGARKSFT